MKIKKIISGKFIENHYHASFVILFVFESLNVILLLHGSANICSMISFGLLLVCAVRLYNAKHGPGWGSHDTLWLVHRSQQKEGQYSEACLKIATRLWGPGLVASVLGVVFTIIKSVC